jgi:cytochrome c biogenesis protein CcdA
MTSMTDVYGGGVGTVATRRRQVFGTALFVGGVAMVVGAIPLATTDLGSALGLGVYGARELAGILAGLGVPAVFVGIFTVLPAGRVTRATAAIGASLAVFGVAVFGYAYPYNWMAADPTLAIATTVLYTMGTLVTFWCLFVAVATFKRRNDPGGAARLHITDEGKIRVVSAESENSRLGGIGLFGTQPDGEVDTQTNDDEEGETLVPEPSVDDSQPGTGQPDPTSQARPTSDGAGGIQAAPDDGAEVEPQTPTDKVRAAVRERGRPDSYCGNCTHFEYVRHNDEITPYCGFHDDLMDDMDACDQWEPNS